MNLGKQALAAFSFSVVILCVTLW